MEVITNAGKFELECWTDASPLWVALRVNGQEVEHAHITVDDLHDLIHAAQRMIDKAKP
ncbi:MAG: hypothetical protein LCH78_18185 [Proteobacteria bacterium]|nr:hypothetical protein [Pseudomonadota bacterium]